MEKRAVDVRIRIGIVCSTQEIARCRNREGRIVNAGNSTSVSCVVQVLLPSMHVVPTLFACVEYRGAIELLGKCFDGYIGKKSNPRQCPSLKKV